MRLLFHRDARAALDALAGDPAAATLYRRVVRALLTIRRDPGGRQARRQAWRTDEWGQVWAVPVRADSDWVVVWQPYDPGAVIVLYIGEAVG